MNFLPRTNDRLETVFDNLFLSPIFSMRSDMIMKTDISENDGNYLLDMELPGCKKEDIHLEIKGGYLSVSASHNVHNDEKDDKGNLIRQERYSGSFSRSFYVGENLREEDIKASYVNGELKISFPKEAKKEPVKKTILIE